MKKYANGDKRTTAKRLGVLYFILVGLVNFCATVIFAKTQAFDVYLLVWSCLPLIIGNKTFSATYGIVAGLVALIIAFSCLKFNLDAHHTTSQFSFMMGYLLSASMLFGSFLLIYGDTKRA